MKKNIIKILHFNWIVYLSVAITIMLCPKILGAYLNQVPNYLLSNIQNLLSQYNLYISSLFFILAFISFFRPFKSKKIFYSVHDINSLRGLDWREFEILTAQIMRSMHYRVQEQGGARADGGIDLIAYKKNFKYIIQCKHWKTTTVGVKIVREMLGVSIHEKASGVYIFTCGKFTKEAIEFAKEKRVYLVNGQQICRLLEKLKNSKSA